MNVYLPNLRLPSAYQEVEYIGTSGTQYIDSGVTIGSSTNNEIIEGKIQFNSNSSAQVNGKNQKKVLFFGTNASNVFYGGIGDNYGNTSLTNDGNTHIFKISQSEYKLYVDGTGYTLTSTAFSGDIYSSNIYIGAASDAYIGAARFHCKENIYYFKIWQGGSLVRDFVPCYRKSDNVIGLYDLVNNQFYTNAGTGTFSKGNDVTMAELKNAYIGEYREWTPNANTVAYYPFKSDLNNYQGSSAWSVTRGSTTYSDNMVRVNTIRHSGNLFTGTGDFTVLAYMNFIDTGFTLNLWSDDSYWYPRFRVSNSFFGIWSPSNSGTWYRIDFTAVDTNNHLMVFVRKNNSIYGYIDGVSVGSNTTVPSINVTGGLGCYIGGFYNNNSDGKIGNLIIENRAWTDDEILKFYNRSKANYGL